jgi:hypothetical protein
MGCRSKVKDKVHGTKCPHGSRWADTRSTNQKKKRWIEECKYIKIKHFYSSKTSLKQ